MSSVARVGQFTYLYLHNWNIRQKCRNKLNRIYIGKNIYAVEKSIKEQYCSLWESMGVKADIKFLKCACTISGVVSPYFVPEYIYYTWIEPALNHYLFAIPYNDKNFFERYLHEFQDMFPSAYLRGSADEFYDGSYNRLSSHQVFQRLSVMASPESYILKPAIETGAGDNVSVLNISKKDIIVDNTAMNHMQFIEMLRKKYNMNFIIQERIKQSDWFSSFNNQATNIIRMFAYRSVLDNRIHVLHTYIRYAAENSTFQDYLRDGGYRRGINNDGQLAAYSINRYGDVISDIAIPLLSRKNLVPYYSSMIEAVKLIGSRFYHHRLLGFDFIVDSNDKIRLLEVNLRNIGMIHHQLIDGPLFGEYFDEVVTYCRDHIKSASVHFYYK